MLTADAGPGTAQAAVEAHAPAGIDCVQCDATLAETVVAPIDQAVLARSAQRVAELKVRGGECAVYGAVLESSSRSGRISMRPFMWRVEGRLVAGEARTDSTMIVAREIDPLNIGVRTVDDVVWTLEHEAAHIAFRIQNASDAVDDLANARVQACR